LNDRPAASDAQSTIIVVLASSAVQPMPVPVTVVGVVLAGQLVPMNQYCNVHAEVSECEAQVSL
jgi:hypothetical protein